MDETISLIAEQEDVRNIFCIYISIFRKQKIAKPHQLKNRTTTNISHSYVPILGKQGMEQFHQL